MISSQIQITKAKKMSIVQKMSQEQKPVLARSASTAVSLVGVVDG